MCLWFCIFLFRFHWDEGGGGGVVAGVVGEDDGAGGVGVAVGAEMGAGVVHADVFAGDAATGGALAFVFELFAGGREGDGVVEEGGFGELAGVEVVDEGAVVVPEAFDEVAVDAAVVGDGVFVEVDAFGAGGEGEVPAGIVPGVAAFGEPFGERDALGFGGFGGGDVFGGEAGGFAEEVLLDFAVVADIDEAEYEFVGAAFEAVADAPDAGEEVTGRELGGEDKGVEAPDDALFAEEVGEAAEGVDAFCEGRDVGLEAFRLVVVEGELEVIVDAAAVEFRKVGDEGCGVFGPEYDGFDALEVDVHGFLVEGVAPEGVACVEAVHEPFGVECRDVRGTAGGEDDGGDFGRFGGFHGVGFYFSTFAVQMYKSKTGIEQLPYSCFEVVRICRSIGRMLILRFLFLDQSFPLTFARLLRCSARRMEI